MKTIISGRWNRHSSDYAETKNLWRIRNQFDKVHKQFDLGKATKEELLAVQEKLLVAQDAVKKLLLDQLEVSEVSVVGDGCFCWDSVFDVSRGILGCTGFKQLTRIRLTNHFHRQPVANLPLLRGEPILDHDYRKAREITSKSIVMCLPGPYSLAHQTENVGKIGLQRLGESYANILNEEIQDLLQNPGTIVRIEEPLAPQDEVNFTIFEVVLHNLVREIDQSQLALTIDFRKILFPKHFFALPFGIFFVDFLENDPEILRYFQEGKRLVAEVIDGRQTYNDPVRFTKYLLQRIDTHIPLEQVFVTTSSDLHFLPWNKSLEKVGHLTKIAQTPINEIGKILPCRISKPYRRPIERPRMVASRPADLKSLGIEAIPFPTSAVGSYSQNDNLRRARALLKKGETSEQNYRAIVETLTRKWMKFQEEIDMTFPVSGEFRREDMAVYFGVELGGQICDFIPSYENRRYRPIEYRLPIVPLNRSMLLRDFEFVQSLTTRPAKETITGPATLAAWALIKNRLYYYDRNAFRMDLALALRGEIERLIEGGVRIIQVDEPALTTNLENFESDLRAIHETIAGLENHAYFILHICYSDMDDLDRAFPKILQLPFQQIHMEMANRNYQLLEVIKRYGFADKDIGFGVIDVHTDRIETVDEIVAGVRKALVYFRPHQIWLTPDCGLKERSDEVARQKLRIMTEAARVCRKF